MVSRNARSVPSKLARPTICPTRVNTPCFEQHEAIGQIHEVVEVVEHARVVDEGMMIARSIEFGPTDDLSGRIDRPSITVIAPQRSEIVGERIDGQVG